MKSVILSAGQGRRLLPLTEDQPKCAIPIHGRAILEWQINELIKFGISPIHVVVGFGAAKVEKILAHHDDHTLASAFKIIVIFFQRNFMEIKAHG